MTAPWDVAGAGDRGVAPAVLSADLVLYLYLYGTIAVAVLGAGGPPKDTRWTVSYIISDRLANNPTAHLVAIALLTATIGGHRRSHRPPPPGLIPFIYRRERLMYRGEIGRSHAHSSSCDPAGDQRLGGP